jgi:hypothetical protein
VGSVVISVDAELGWGFHDYEVGTYTDRIAAGRTGWHQLIELFERYDIPATWAVVGHLFLDDCDGVHEDHPAPAEWFARDRLWRSRPDLRLGGDLISELLTSPVEHDVGSHTFSHVICTDPWVTHEVMRAELTAAAEAARPFGVEMRSFVFPRNAVAYRDVLAEFGFTTYRGAAIDEPTGLASPVDKLLKTAFPARVPLVHPIVDEYGLVNVPPSLFLFSLGGVPRDALTPLVGDPIVRQATGAIDRAVKEDGVFHAWLHPNNLLDSRDTERVRAILAHIRRRVDETDLTVTTMRDLADEVLADRGVRRPTPTSR